MRYIFMLLTLTFSLSAQALVCGLYQIEDFNDRVLYSLTDFHTFRDRQIHFTIQNPGAEAVKNMAAGSCYCVSGKIWNDPEFEFDNSFRVILVEQLLGMPYRECGPI